MLLSLLTIVICWLLELLHRLQRWLNEVFDKFHLDLVIFLDELHIVNDFATGVQQETADACLRLDPELRSDSLAKRSNGIVPLIHMHKHRSQVFSALDAYGDTNQVTTFRCLHIFTWTLLELPSIT